MKNKEQVIAEINRLISEAEYCGDKERRRLCARVAFLRQVLLFVAHNDVALIDAQYEKVKAAISAYNKHVRALGLLGARSLEGKSALRAAKAEFLISARRKQKAYCEYIMS